MSRRIVDYITRHDPRMQRWTLFLRWNTGYRHAANYILSPDSDDDTRVPKTKKKKKNWACVIITPGFWGAIAMYNTRRISGPECFCNCNEYYHRSLAKRGTLVSVRTSPAHSFLRGVRRYLYYICVHIMPHSY